jgi:hypothetical protein
VVDLQHRRFEVFRESDGVTYRQQQTIADEPIALVAFPEITVNPVTILN